MNEHTLNINQIKSFFFIGVAGAGMSAIAQYLAGVGKQVAGSDRLFAQQASDDTRQKLEQAGIRCFVQDGSGLSRYTQAVVVSTAIEEQNPEIQKARALNIPIVHRAELLAAITRTRKTIAVAGTSGKSTVTAMIYEILRHAFYEPSVITGAGLVRLQQRGLIGNAAVGKGEWLVIEADESDGSLVQYTPEVGIILNIDKDHKEIDELLELFATFANNVSERLIVNDAHLLSASLSRNRKHDFGYNSVGFIASGFEQKGFETVFTINNQPLKLPLIGRHNLENALAAVAVCVGIGVSLQTCAEALQQYQGIDRRLQIVGTAKQVLFIDDYAHNPVKVAAAIQACKPLCKKLIAWFQPHGYGPTRFLRHDFVSHIAHVLRPDDQMVMSEIYYAGGTAVKDISAGDLIADLTQKGVQAFFVPNRNDLTTHLQQHAQPETLVLLMGARDGSLGSFAKQTFEDFGR